MDDGVLPYGGATAPLACTASMRPLPVTLHTHLPWHGHVARLPIASFSPMFAAPTGSSTALPVDRSGALISADDQRTLPDKTTKIMRDHSVKTIVPDADVDMHQAQMTACEANNTAVRYKDASVHASPVAGPAAPAGAAATKTMCLECVDQHVDAPLAYAEDCGIIEQGGLPECPEDDGDNGNSAHNHVTHNDDAENAHNHDGNFPGNYLTPTMPAVAFHNLRLPHVAMHDILKAQAAVNFDAYDPAFDALLLNTHALEELDNASDKASDEKASGDIQTPLAKDAMPTAPALRDKNESTCEGKTANDESPIKCEPCSDENALKCEVNSKRMLDEYYEFVVGDWMKFSCWDGGRKPYYGHVTSVDTKTGSVIIWYPPQDGPTTWRKYVQHKGNLFNPDDARLGRPVVMERLSSRPNIPAVLCGTDGCILLKYHPGLCACPQSSKRARPSYA